MIIQAELKRKQSEYKGEACSADKVIELPAQRFQQGPDIPAGGAPIAGGHLAQDQGQNHPAKGKTPPMWPCGWHGNGLDG